MRSQARSFSPLNFKTRLPALDGIRAMAVTLVFLNHFGGGAHGGPLLRLFNQFRGFGWVGVDLFFVLSGFLITGILYDTRTDSRFFSRFFARRSVRIFPAFYLVAVILLGLTIPFHYLWHWQHLWFLVYLGNIPANGNFSLYDVMSRDHPLARVFIGHFWSLCVEEQFYLFWPVLVWLIRDRVRLLWTASAICLLSLGSRVWIVTHLSDVRSEQLIFRSLPFRIDTLLVGGILALLLRGPRADQWQRAAKWVAALATIPILLIFYNSAAISSPWLLSVGLTCLALASAGLVGMTARPGSPAFRIFHVRPLRVLGRYSYGFYIFHTLYAWAWIQLLVHLREHLHSVILAGLITIPSNFLLTFLISKLSYDFYELRFLALKKRFQYDSEMTQHEHAYSLQS